MRWEQILQRAGVWRMLVNEPDESNMTGATDDSYLEKVLWSEGSGEEQGSCADLGYD